MVSRGVRREFLGSLAVVVALSAVLVPAASAHTGTAAISCTSVGFAFNAGSGFTSGTVTVNETVSIDGTVAATGSTQVVNDGGASNTISIAVPSGTHTVVADASTEAQGEVVGFPVTATVTCSSQGGGNSPAKLCQMGGYANLYNASTGAAFADQSACVRYGAQGGTYSSLKWTVSVAKNFVTFTLSGFGLKPGSGISYTPGSSLVHLVVAPDGTLPDAFSVSAPCGQGLSVSATGTTSGGATITTPTVNSPCG